MIIDEDAKYIDFIKNIYENSKVGIFVLDPQFKVIWINRAIEKYFGIKREEIVGKDKRRIIKRHIQYTSPNSENYNQRIKTSGINDFSARDIICHILPSDKRKEYWLEYCSQPIKSGRYAGGRIEQYIDITDYKKTEKRNSEYVKELEIISEMAVNLIRYSDIDHICHYIGQKIYEMCDKSYVMVTLFDRESEKIYIKDYFGLDRYLKSIMKIAPKDPRKMGYPPEDMTEEEKKIFTSHKLEVVTGGLYALSTRKIPMNISHLIENILGVKKIYTIGFALENIPYGGVIILSRREVPITYKSAIELMVSYASLIMNRLQAEEALKKSRQEFISIFKNSPEAAVYMDKKGRIVDINSRFTKVFGYTLKEIKGKNINCGIIHPPSKTEEGKKIDKRVLTEGYVSIETIRKRKDGTLFPVLITSSSAKLVGEFKGLVSLYQDITERKKSAERIRKTLESTINIIVKVVEFRDPYTAGHQQRVSRLATAIAKKLGLSEDKQEAIRITCLVHDVGKINIPSEILNKPGKLSNEEFGLIKEHPRTGYDILKTMEFPWPIAEIVYQHHEKYNGTGYPQGLSGKQTLLEARIIQVAGVVDAMSSHRPYRPALSIDKTLEEISQNKGILYDPEIVDTCLELFRKEEFNF